MCSAKEFFESRSSEELAEFLLDTFDRHSCPDDIDKDELAHIKAIARDIAQEFGNHPVNKTLSHEMWAATTIMAQFKKMSDPAAKMPELLGEKIYNNPTFFQSFLHLRDSMRAQQQLIRA